MNGPDNLAPVGLEEASSNPRTRRKNLEFLESSPAIPARMIHVISGRRCIFLWLLGFPLLLTLI